MGDAKRRAAEIVKMKEQEKKLKPKMEELGIIPKSKDADNILAQAGTVEQMFNQAEGQTIAEFLHFVLNAIPKVNEQMIVDVLTTAHHSVLGSQVDPETETVICYYKDRSCLSVRFIHGDKDKGEQDSIEVKSGREIVIPSHVKTLQ